MTVLVYAIFLPVAALSISGWGSLALPREGEWSRRFGAGTLTVFFLTAAAGWSGVLVPVVLWTFLAAGLLLWAIYGRFGMPRKTILLILSGLPVIPLVMLPPASRDALIHHLYQARLWLDAGRIVRPEWSGFFSYPYLTETLYALTGGTFGFRFARAVSFLGFLAACSVPFTWFLSRGRKREALFSLLVLLSVPELFRNASWSYSDSFLVFFALLSYREMTGPGGRPVMAVVWGAAAACCKYNGMLVLVSILVLLPYYFRGISRKALAASLLAALFVCGWWALPNLLQWGNPVYPLMEGLFGPEAQTGSREAGYFASAGFGTSLHGPLDYLLLPVRMSIHGRWDDPVHFDGASGPLLLAGAIMALPVLRGKRRKFMLPILYLLLALAFKGQAVRTRYMLPGLAMLAFPVSETLTSLTDRSRSSLVRTSTAALTSVCIVWSGVMLAGLYVDQRPFDLPPDGDYLERELPHHRFFEECDRFVSPDDTTMMINIGRVFYYPGHAVFDEHRAPLELVRMFWAGMDSEDVSDSLSRAGIDLVAADMFLTSINVPPVLEGEELENWREFVSLGLEPLLTVDSYVLFRLRR
ncbi:MAG: hypothetical protein AVO35_11460 [Candidatus Aegiribacteria sp. MLS_C]|nr:MAG: hypothetical protein AVO35_11460 [Candidatus Aegiribacteria sp. MLS_C]